MNNPVKPLIALWRKPAARLVLGAGTMAMLGMAVGLGVGTITRACAAQKCPSISEVEGFRPQQSIKFYAADGRLVEDLGLQSRTVLPLEEMSSAIPAAFLAIEDKRFYRHRGVDYIRFFGALRRNILTLSYGEGFSSITQQTARNIFPDRLPSEKAISRKVREVMVALELERNYSKERILELYLNQLFLGGSAYGVEAASQRYFGKSARELNVAEAAMLAAMAPGPNGYDPRRFPDRVTRRRNVVIGLMHQEGFLSAEQAEWWRAYPLEVSSREDYAGVAPYFVEWVRQQLYDRLGASMYTRGYRVYTTLDLDLQIAAEQALEDQLQEIESEPNFPHITYAQYLADTDGLPPKVRDTPYLQGALVTLDTNGNVLAMVGGRHFNESEFNRATQGERQAGSTFKPFVYSAAIRAGVPASHIIDDAPISLMQDDTLPWDPQNFEGNFRGPTTLRAGLYRSRNLVAIKLGLEIGVSAVVGEARNYGISSPIPQVPSTFIGSSGVRMLEMASAYTSFASLGNRAYPIGILRVEDADGNIVLEPRPRKQPVMERDRAWIVTNMLTEVVNRGTAYTGVRVTGGLPGQIRAGGKTGTTNDGGDTWFVGFTPEIVTAIWMGFDLKKRILTGSVAGGALAAPVFGSYMREVYSRRPAPDNWEAPTSLNLQARSVDMITGDLATDFCPPAEKYVEWFVPGTEPTAFCRVHLPRFGITALPGGFSQRHAPPDPYPSPSNH